MEGVLNFREMGGLPAAGGSTVRSGVLFRSGHWSQATEGDVVALAELHLTAVIDFRTPVDIEADGGPDRLPPGIDYMSLEMVDAEQHGVRIRRTLMSRDQALIDERYGNGQARQLSIEAVHRMATRPEKQAVFGRFLRTVVEAGGRPLLWHCSAGKDRAGWAATLLGIALGVPDEALVAHYLASNIHRPPQSRIDHYAALGIDVEVMRPLFMVHEDYIAQGLAAIDEGWPSRHRYLAQALGFDQDCVERLREALLV